jgi:polyribonucleotide nucleotidyltransferase
MHAPRIVTIKIKQDRIRDLIGPGGKTIRGIVDQTGCKIDVSDDGTVLVASSDGDAMQKALEIIRGLTAEAEVGRIYRGTVRRVVDFGAFVEIMPGTDGLVHISQLANERVRQVTDVVREGDLIDVKVLEVDRSGKIRLSRKDAPRRRASETDAGHSPSERHPRPLRGAARPGLRDGRHLVENGSRYERPDQAGISRFLEHLFKRDRATHRRADRRGDRRGRRRC